MNLMRRAGAPESGAVGPTSSPDAKVPVEQGPAAARAPTAALSSNRGRCRPDAPLIAVSASRGIAGVWHGVALAALALGALWNVVARTRGRRAASVLRANLALMAVPVGPARTASSSRFERPELVAIADGLSRRRGSRSGRGDRDWLLTLQPCNAYNTRSTGIGTLIGPRLTRSPAMQNAKGGIRENGAQGPASSRVAAADGAVAVHGDRAKRSLISRSLHAVNLGDLAPSRPQTAAIGREDAGHSYPRTRWGAWRPKNASN